MGNVKKMQGAPYLPYFEQKRIFNEKISSKTNQVKQTKLKENIMIKPLLSENEMNLFAYGDRKWGPMPTLYQCSSKCKIVFLRQTFSN